MKIERKSKSNNNRMMAFKKAYTIKRVARNAKAKSREKNPTKQNSELKFTLTDRQAWNFYIASSKLNFHFH